MAEIGPPKLDPGEDARKLVRSIVEPSKEDGFFGKIFDRIEKGTRKARTEPLGPSEKTVTKLAGKDILLRSAIKTGGTTADLLFRALDIPLKAGAAAIAQTAESLGVDQGMSSRLERDIGALPEALGPLGIQSAGIRTGMPKLPKNVEKAEDAILLMTDNLKGAAKNSRQASLRKRFAQEFKKDPDTDVNGVISRVEFGPVRTGTEQKFMTPQIKAGQQMLLREAGFRPQPNKPIEESLVEVLSGDKLSDIQIQALMKRAGLSADDAKQVLGKGPRQAAFALNPMAQAHHAIATKRLQGLTGDSRAFTQWKAMTEKEKGGNIWARVHVGLMSLDAKRRGLMVSNLGTAARNAMVAGGRIGLDTIQEALDATMGSAARSLGARVPDAQPWSAVGNTIKMAMSAKGRKQAEEVLRGFPQQSEKLFARLQSDERVSRTIKVGGQALTRDMELSTADKIVQNVNVFNWTQERYFRTLKVAASLDRDLRKRGKTLQGVIDKNDMGAVNEKMMHRAVDDALDLTFAADPHTKTVKNIVKAINNMPFLATAEIPFARFMANALRFNFENSPLGVTRLLNPKILEKVKAGDTSAISKSMIGTAMLGAALELKSQPSQEGAKWNEIILPDGRTIDTTAFAPFSLYLWLADVALRSPMTNETVTDILPFLGKGDKKVQQDFGSKEVLEGFGNITNRLGTGFQVTDELIRWMNGQPDILSSGTKGLERGTGQVLASFLTPLRQFADVYMDYTGDRKVRTTREDTVFGPIKKNIPGADQGKAFGVFQTKALPELHLPTQEKVPEKVGAFGLTSMRQLGLTVGEKKTPLAKELDRLDFDFTQVSPLTGVARADRLITKNMKPEIRLLNQYVQTDAWKSMGKKEPRAQIEQMKELLKASRKRAKERAQAEDPKLFLAMSMARSLGRGGIELLNEKLRNAGFSDADVTRLLHELRK